MQNCSSRVEIHAEENKILRKKNARGETIYYLKFIQRKVPIFCHFLIPTQQKNIWINFQVKYFIFNC